MILWIEASRHKFQFTPLREGRRKQRLALINGIVNFNSRPCVRGDATTTPRRWGCILFQFTPLREGRQRRGMLHSRSRQISIHAPA